jgi:DnaJ-class molecular chaperone
MSNRIGNGIYKEQKLVDAEGHQLTKEFDPEKYGMTLCSACQGHGFTENDEGRYVCLKCGGFGLTKKEETPY